MGLLALAALVPSAPPVVAAPAAPAIAVDRPEFDFGKVAEGGTIRHVFKVKNAGDAPLEIKSVSAACGCTAAAPREKTIAPGRTGEIEVKFDTRGRPGLNHKTVTVVSNDPKRPTLTLMIKAEVEQMLGFQPAYTQIDAFGGEPATAEIWLSGQLAPRARPRVVKVEPPAPARAEVIEKVTGAGKQKGLRIAVDGKQIGRGSTQVSVETGLSQLPRIEHVVIWSVQGNIQAPRQIHLDLLEPTAREQVVQVTSRRPDFQLKSARVLEGPFRATLLAATTPQRSIKLTTTLSTPPATPTMGKLLLESNDPLEPKKEVLLSVAATRTRR